jgi:hypothetical protein
MQGDPDLFEVRDVLGSTCRFTRGLDGRDHQADQDPDDGDYDQGFDQGEAPTKGSPYGPKARRCGIYPGHHGGVPGASRIDPVPPMPI